MTDAEINQEMKFCRERHDELLNLKRKTAGPQRPLSPMEYEEKLRTARAYMSQMSVDYLRIFDGLDSVGLFLTPAFEMLQAVLGPRRSLAYLRDFCDDIERLTPPNPEA